jgi:hypothetical protein
MAESQHERFLAKAKEAEDAALKAESPVARQAWQTVAETYRMLAADTAKLR